MGKNTKLATKVLKKRLDEISDIHNVLYEEERNVRARYYELIIRNALRDGLLNEAEWELNIGHSYESVYLSSDDKAHAKLMKAIGPAMIGGYHASVSISGNLELRTDDGSLTLREKKMEGVPARDGHELLFFIKEKGIRVHVRAEALRDEAELRKKLAAYERLRSVAEDINKGNAEQKNG